MFVSYQLPDCTREHTRRTGFPQPVHRQQNSPNNNQTSPAENQHRTNPEPSFTFRNNAHITADVNQRDVYFRVRQLPRTRVIRSTDSGSGGGGGGIRWKRLERTSPRSRLVKKCDVHMISMRVASCRVRRPRPPVSVRVVGTVPDNVFDTQIGMVSHSIVFKTVPRCHVGGHKIYCVTRRVVRERVRLPPPVFGFDTEHRTQRLTRVGYPRLYRA